MKREASAPGKIILSGEYAVAFGYTGIAIPAPVGIHASYTEQLGQPGFVLHWPGVHVQWREYVEKIIERCRAENDHIFGSLTITADIPLGKGMGSSTALIIAICRALLGENCEVFARQIEDELNPGHSGIDFATIWQNCPIEFIKDQEPKMLRLETDILEGTQLLDTGAPNEQTPELVAWMQDKAVEVQSALETIGRCSQRIIAGEDVRSVIKDHHQAQIALGVVPSKVQKMIKKIEQEGGAAKVIGAGGRTGGGGMVLAFLKN